MTTNPTDVEDRPGPPATRTTDKGLRGGSVGLAAAVALGLSSVAPAYSIAVTLGLVTLTVGQLAPAALLLGFVPILLTAFAFRELNREMPDCGTGFVWTTRAFGPSVGWLANGRVPQMATQLAMAALARVGASYLLDLLGLTGLADSEAAVAVTALLLLVSATATAHRGLRLAASVQYVMLGLQLFALLGFGVAAFLRPGAEAPSPYLARPAGLRRLRFLRRGGAALPVHLLGLGRADHRQRGDQGRQPGLRPGRRHLHPDPARQLPVHRLRRDRLRRDGRHRHRPGQPGQRGRRPGHPRPAGARHRARQGDAAGGLRLGGLGPAHQPGQQLARRPVDERARRPRRPRSPGSTRATAPPASGRSSSAPPPPPCWSCSRCSPAPSWATPSSASAC